MQCSERDYIWGGMYRDRNAYIARCLVMLCYSIFSMKNQLVEFFMSTPHTLMISGLLLQIVTYCMCAFLNLLKRQNGVALPDTRLYAHSCCCMWGAPLLLHYTAPLRVILFARTYLWQFWLLYCQEPSHMYIYVAVYVPTYVFHPTVVYSPAKGYFTCRNPSVAVLVIHPPPKWYG